MNSDGTPLPLYAAASRGRQNRLALHFFNIHETIVAEPPKNKNPTVGFLARFFLEA
jgi:hypothetical protein